MVDMKFGKVICINIPIYEKEKVLLYKQIEDQLINFMRSKCQSDNLELISYTIEIAKSIFNPMGPPMVRFRDGTIFRSSCDAAMRITWETEDEPNRQTTPQI